jgi:hypothetical protein
MANFMRKSSHTSIKASHWLPLIPCILLVAAQGCQRCQHAGPYSCVKVSGKVTFEDGSPIPADRIRLVFVSLTPPVDPKTPPHAGFAELSISRRPMPIRTGSSWANTRSSSNAIATVNYRTT